MSERENKMDQDDAEGALGPGSKDDAVRKQLDALLARLEPFWPDVLRHGSVEHGQDSCRTQGCFLTFQQERTGPRDGSEKRIHLGQDHRLAQMLEEEIRRRREAAGVSTCVAGSVGTFE